MLLRVLECDVQLARNYNNPPCPYDAPGRLARRSVKVVSSEGARLPAVPDTPTVCPACPTGLAIPIVYGLPTEDIGRDAEAGHVELGGCVVEDDAPVWKCRACGHRW
jgi:hypothetical protein